MGDGTRLADWVRVRQRFSRSANVERDSGREAVSGYLPTARALDVIGRLTSGLVRPADGRALSITGPYGSGKSSLAVFIEALFGPAGHPARRVADAILREADATVAERVDAARVALDAASGGFVPAV